MTNSSNSSAHCFEEEESHWMVPAVLSVVVACLLTAYFMEKYHLVFIPESGVFIAIGIVVGILIKVSHQTESLLNFRRDWFFEFLLPPIILDSGYSMKKSSFFRNFGAICMFAVFGTLISTVFVGLLLWVLGDAGLSYHMTVAESFTFGALISAIDPVATLAVFAHVGAPDQLNAILAGESILNDAVAIVLFRTFEKFTHEVESLGREVGMGIAQFFYISAGSLAIGVLSGLLFSKFTKHVAIRKLPTMETSLFMILAYLTYLVTEALTLSGIMAILFFGQVTAHYGFYNLSVESKVTTRQGVKVLAQIADTTVFVFLGMALLGQELSSFEWPLIGWTLLLAVIARALNVFPIAFVMNLCRKVKDKIIFKTQFIMWFSGLRGAVAFALVMTFPASSDDMYRRIISVTLAIVLITTVAMGGGTLPLLKALKQTKGQQQGLGEETSPDLEMQGPDGAERVPDNEEDELQSDLPKHLFTELVRPRDEMAVMGPQAQAITIETAMARPVYRTQREKNPGCFTRLDERYFKPFFIRPEGIKTVAAARVISAKDVAGQAAVAVSGIPDAVEREQI
eukprot:TRINITY_DN379_c0_g1_i1.p1 TRINITY_DN379_c0_g1~~TRINITY_DN379_c0_g1_i1.p1  ORF type:complete len:637 (+),score=130.78 TRINITY_DN379_c0_g1_i1:205-1911(+)